MAYDKAKEVHVKRFTLLHLMLVLLILPSRPLAGQGTSERWEVLFENGFEEADLFPTDGSLWANVIRQTGPGQPRSIWTRSDEQAHAGQYSAKSFAAPGTRDVGFTCGKASVVNQPLDIEMGDTVEYHIHYYLTSETPVQLLDVECSTLCGGLKGSPGVRVVMTRDRRLRIDWKFLNWFKNNGLPPPPDAPSSARPGSHVLPVGEWFELTLRMQLANGGQGLTEVFVNGEPDSATPGTNIAPQGLEALERYPQIEVGITCNPVNNSQATTVYADDVKIMKLSSVGS